MTKAERIEAFNENSEYVSIKIAKSRVLQTLHEYIYCKGALLDDEDWHRINSELTEAKEILEAE